MNEDWVLSVEQLGEYVRRHLAGDPLLRAVRVRGELSGFKRHTSGHLYFAIKDEKARVQCVMFRQNALSLDFEPRDGQMVVVSGSASLYVASGAFQLYCQGMRREGAGELFLRFEALKEKLSREGLFDPARKRPLPLLPRRVGIVTSPTGAALRDMVRVARRRDPGVDILLCPAQVQGAAAAGEIVAALEALNRHGGCDVILVGRGGGSMEDLWPFNEEKVARAIAASRIPVVSCVGHETDFTIADFVADVRAATPSMAAELVVPVRAELLRGLDQLQARLNRAQLGGLALRGAALDKLALRLGSPVQALLSPRRDKLAQWQGRLEKAMAQRIARESGRLDQLARTLEALNPGGVLDRGYALITADGRALTQAGELRPDQQIGIRMKGGSALARVLSVEEERAHGGQKKAEL